MALTDEEVDAIARQRIGATSPPVISQPMASGSGLSDADVDRIARERLGYAPQSSTMGNVWEGIKQSPNMLWEGAKSIGNFIANPIDTITEAGAEKTARVTGGIAAQTAGMLPGAAAGAAAGAPLAPFTFGLSVPVGGIIGAGLGMAGGQAVFDQANQLIGNDVDTPIQEDINQAALNVGRGIGGGALIKGVGALGRVSGAGLVKGSRALGNRADALREKALGVRPSDKIKANKVSGINLVDDAGQSPATIEQIVAAEGGIERAIGTLKDEGFFGKSSDTSKLYAKASEKASELSAQVDNQIALADRIGFMQKFEPKWVAAEQYIDDLKGASPSQAKSLAKELSEIKQEWSQGPGTIEALQKLKRKIGGIAYDKNSTAEITGFRKALYKGLQESIEQNVDSLIKGPPVKGINARASAYYQAQKTLQRKLAAGDPSILSNIVNLPNMGLGALTAATSNPVFAGMALARTLAKMYPVQFSRGLDVASAPVKAAGRATQAGSTVASQIAQQLLPAMNGQKIIVPPSMFLPQENKPQAAISQPQAQPENDAFAQLLGAVIHVESRGKKDAVSPKKAKGIAQLMDATGSTYHKRLKDSGVEIADVYDPFDPEQSKIIASAFLTDLLKKYDDARVAIAAYNLGEPKIDRALKKAKGNTWEDIFPYVPSETQNYVPSVMAALG